MKAIIVAAGMGRRLSPYTDDRPKCLVEIAGRPMLARQLDTYRAAGVTGFVIVRGYLADRLTAALSAEPDVTFVDNRDYGRNNILCSLMFAEQHMDGGFLFSYSDIVFRPALVTAVRDAPGELALLVDQHYASVYEGRTDHPIEEAELAEVKDGRVLRVGKRAVPREEAQGEFIGLLRASAAGAARMRETFHRRKAALGMDAPYGRAPRLEVAYLTDLLADLIAQGADVRAAFTPGPDSWREIDTVQDLERARRVIDW
jgi:L-glutamine-phosphate cytidylyltransferase